MQQITTEQALRNAVASAEMEGLHPTEQDIRMITAFLNAEITREELIQSVIAEVKGQ